MKNAPVVVIRNRNESIKKKYRIRNLITGTMSYVDSVSLVNPIFLGNIDDMKGLKPEQVVACNWALTGSLAEKRDVMSLKNRISVQTEPYGFTMPGGAYYQQEDHGVMNGLHFGEEGNRFVCVK